MVSSCSPASRPLVLLLQPESDDREMYAEFLRYRRFQPAVATTIADGLRLAPAADVIVTGIALPGGGDGLEFIARVRGNELTKSTPLIVLTAKLLTTEQYEAARSACDGFLRKPCLPDALVREVRRVLASGRLRAARAKPVKSDLAPKRGGAAPRELRGAGRLRR